MTIHALPVLAFVLMYAFPAGAFPGGLPKRMLLRIGHAGFAASPGALILWACPGMDNVALVSFGLTVVGVGMSGLILLSKVTFVQVAR